LPRLHGRLRLVLHRIRGDAMMLVAGMIAVVCAADHLPTPDLAVPLLDDAHGILAEVLTASVRSGGVDYAALRQNRVALDRYRAQLAATPLPTAREAQLALWINAYNAHTLALVLHLLPTDTATWPSWSIRSGGGADGSVWQRWTMTVAGTDLSLDAMEHARLRPLGEPRIHLAITCASRSCPPLAAAPYQAATLEAQLRAATAAFVSDPRQVRVADGAVVTNPILAWFADDFGGASGVRTFLQNAGGPAADALARGAQVVSGTYDWSLNLPRSTP
jgi:hypothetical protein